MLTFKQFLTEAKKSKVLVMMYGRMNPVNYGHEQNVEFMRKLAEKYKADHLIVASHSHDDEHNPIPPEKKLKHLQRAFPGMNVTLSTKEHPTIMHHVKAANAAGYKHLVLVGGADRADEFSKLLQRYNGKEYHFNSITVKSPSQKRLEISATDMRKHAADGNFRKFRKGLPVQLRDKIGYARSIYKDTRGNLKK